MCTLTIKNKMLVFLQNKENKQDAHSAFSLSEQAIHMQIVHVRHENM